MKRALVVTTIAKPTNAMLQLAAGAVLNDIDFYVIGDKKTPHFSLAGSKYYSLELQQAQGMNTARFGPINSYTRKNVGYILAMTGKPDAIVETDDDNIPMAGFWDEPKQKVSTSFVDGKGWANVYRLFNEAKIWPRGLPLDEINTRYASTYKKDVNCPIQQGLANGDPDVDAIYRLITGGDTYFYSNRSIALGQNVWCPFNSQNTTWFREAFPLMYLPSTCTFRMTDIWRSFVAQRILWVNDQNVFFKSPTVFQKRNEHNLMDDFAQEVPGYLNNKKIADGLSGLSLKKGHEHTPDNMRLCYEWFVSNKLLDSRDLALLEYWLLDVENAGGANDK